MEPWLEAENDYFIECFEQTEDIIPYRQFYFAFRRFLFPERLSAGLRSELKQQPKWHQYNFKVVRCSLFCLNNKLITDMPCPIIDVCGGKYDRLSM